MLTRILEPEIMDSADDAREYDTMDHSAVNTQFVTDLLATFSHWSLQRPVNPDTSSPPLRILDLGVGTAQIPIELAGRAPHIHITAVDAASSMLALARENITRAGLTERIHPIHADAKHLPFADRSFQVIISNSILHHIADPQSVVAEAARVTARAGLLFHRDLARPNDRDQLHQLVETYAADSSTYQRKLFGDSLHAALSIEEVRDLVASFGFARESVQLTSDRHWTWATTVTSE